MKFHGKLTLEKFWMDWFGPLGRVIGTKGSRTTPSKLVTRKWTDNPNDLIEHIKMCTEEHEPNEFCRACFISSQPMRNIGKMRRDGSFVGEACAIEKLFYDFDDDTKYCSKCDIYIKKEDFCKIKEKKGTFCPKCETECFENPRLDVVGIEVKRFVRDVQHPVFIVETRKGYHVYIFLRQIFRFNPSDFEFAKELYKELQNFFIIGEYEFMDDRILGDLNRFARVPMTAHEKTGAVCQIVDRDLKPVKKIRNLEEYKTYGILNSQVERTINLIKMRRRKAYEKEKQEIEEVEEQLKNGNGRFRGIIRPCFQKRMDIGEMCHGQRLAWLAEIYYVGYDTPTKMLELCRKTWNDFTEKVSKQQIADYFKHDRWKWKPYKCTTIMEKGWCLEGDCPIWRERHKVNKKR